MAITFFQWVWLAQAVLGILLPCAILWLGWRINKVLEINRVNLGKEKDWHVEWAKRFYSAAIEYNDAIEECVLLLFFASRIEKEKREGWEKRLKQKEAEASDTVERTQRAEWKLKMAIEFAPQAKTPVLAAKSKVHSQVAELIATKKGNIDDIQASLFEFNQAAKIAHRELLALS